MQFQNSLKAVLLCWLIIVESGHRSLVVIKISSEFANSYHKSRRIALS